MKSDAYLLLREIRETEETPDFKKASPSLLKTVARVFGPYYMMAGLLKVTVDVFIFVQPQLLK